MSPVEFKKTLCYPVDTKAYIPPERTIPGVGVGLGQCTRRQNFALPNAKYTNMLVYFALGNAHFFAFCPTRFTRRVLIDAFYPTPVSGI